jgi:hypothetical protein
VLAVDERAVAVKYNQFQRLSHQTSLYSEAAPGYKQHPAAALSSAEILMVSTGIVTMVPVAFLESLH